MASVNQPLPKKEITPEKELLIDHHRWFTYSEKDTGLRLICLEDLETGAVVTTTVANPSKRTASHKAWAGARQSRAAGMPWDILHEMGEKGVNPDEKLEEMFKNYGHASVGDMARLSVDMGKVPMHFCMALFNEGVLNSGQEKSTRYQPKFGNALLHNIKNYLPEDFPKEKIETLEREYQSFGTLSLELFAKHKEILLQLFEKYYQADMNDKGQKSALVSRVLDCVRYFLLLGQWSGMSFETSARDWSRIIAEMKASPIMYYHNIAAQIEMLLAPSAEIEDALRYKAEAPSLIRHTHPMETTNANLHALKEYIEKKTDLLKIVPIHTGIPKLEQQHVTIIGKKYSAGDRLAAQYVLLLWPGLEKQKLLDWVTEQKKSIKKEISAIMYSNHSNHRELPSFARTTTMTIVVESFLGELRDFNRHRAWGRFIPMPLVFGEAWTRDVVEQILSTGFGLPLYLSEIPEFAEEKKAFEKDIAAYYKKLQVFIDKVAKQFPNITDFSFAINLIPMAHKVDLWMHGDPKQALYFTLQRSRPGGHINYRVLAYEANQVIADSDPYVSALRLDKRPDSASREEFFDRS